MRALAGLYGLTTVVVATDDPAAVGRARRLAPELRFLSLAEFDRGTLEVRSESYILSRMCVCVRVRVRLCVFVCAFNFI